MAGGPPATTVSRDVSFCPMWKRKPHSTYYSQWSAVAVSRALVILTPLRPRLTSQLDPQGNRFKDQLWFPVQKRIGSVMNRIGLLAMKFEDFEEFRPSESTRYPSNRFLRDRNLHFQPKLQPNPLPNQRGRRELRVAGDGAAIGAPVSELWCLEGVSHLLTLLLLDTIRCTCRWKSEIPKGFRTSSFWPGAFTSFTSSSSRELRKQRHQRLYLSFYNLYA
ncbi:hypothetical protein PIB30_051654 [Stylosanthes scabra]|uniref:Uncharacterized protein n=1 Tax=Stylosanthes scabra TaxID=79078 RepID=A0ABU6XGG9_9FABA|nr:hypothetical protein [Stylosanthes scabra]